MKKTICLLMTMVLLLSLCACGQKPAQEAAEPEVQEEAEPTIFVNIYTEGLGRIAYAEGESAPEIDPENPAQYGYLSLTKPALHTFVAAPDAGNVFVKWTKNGEDFSTDPLITVLLDESADFVAVFDMDPVWQNPVMNFVGEYQCGGIHAQVDCFGSEEAWITIDDDRGDEGMIRWIIVGKLDTETLSIDYDAGGKSKLVFDENGEVESADDIYMDGTGTITFRGDGSFIWHEDQSETGEDLVFEWLAVSEDMIGLANPWREASEEEASALCINSFSAPEGAENVRWSVMDSAADESGVPGALVQLSFDLDGNSFTAREQITGDEEKNLAGMYYSWSVEQEETLKDWADGNVKAQVYRYVGEGESIDLCTWYDVEVGVSYSLSVAAADLDGFDVVAVANMLQG